MPSLDRPLLAMARRYCNWRVPADDLMQEGRIAAWEAERTWDDRRGISFACYALMAARCAMFHRLKWPRSNRVAEAPYDYDALTPAEQEYFLAGRDFAPMLIDTLSPSESKPARQSLTRSELAVLRLMCAGLEAREAADKLFVSKRAVDFHLSNIYRKWGVKKIIPAYNEAMRRGLIEPPARDL